MWTKFWRQAGVLTVTLGIIAGLTGCMQTPSGQEKPADKPMAARHGMVKMQVLLEAHPQSAKLRQAEQELAALGSNQTPSQAAIDAAKQEFEAAMKARQNEDLQAIERKETQIQESLNDERKKYIESLESEYRQQLFNLDLKLQTIRYSASEKQKLQAERDQLEAARQQKLRAKDAELAEKYKRETSAYAEDLKRKAEVYADQWMKERASRLKPDTTADPELERKRRELNELSGRIMQDIKRAVSLVAEQEKLEMVWVYPVVRQNAKDVTDAVKRELMK